MYFRKGNSPDKVSSRVTETGDSKSKGFDWRRNGRKIEKKRGLQRKKGGHMILKRSREA